MTIRIKNWKRFQHFRDRRPPWIKLYRDILDDIEWHKLNPGAAKTLVMLWLIASEDDGRLPPLEELAFRLRTTESQVESTVSQLSHWIEQDDITPISPRYQGDPPEERRERGETDPISRPDIGGNGLSPDDMATLWNEAVDFYAKDSDVLIPKVLKLTDGRKKKALARIKDCDINRERWLEIVNAVHRSKFLSGKSPGKGHEDWKAGFDFVLKSQETVTKILEGGYS